MPPAIPSARRDLEFHERSEGEDVVVIVRDPLRNEYFRFNQLQAAFLRELDGQKSYQEIAEKLGDAFEVDIPRSAVERFVAHARKQLLLEIDGHDEAPPRARRLLEKELKKLNINLRRVARAQVPKTEACRGAALLAEGGRRLDRGELGQAADAFNEAARLDPGDRAANTMLDALRRAWLKAAAAPDDFPKFPLFNPDRLLRFLCRTIGPFIFSTAGVAVLAAFFFFSLYLYADLSLSEVHFGTGDIVLGIAFRLLETFLHELGHGLACRWFGGPVIEIGMFLFFYILPVPYCDTSSTYLFKEKRPKIIVQLAGTMTSLLAGGVQIALLTVLQPTTFIYPALVLALGVNFAFFVVNFIPLLKADGYYALSDGLGITNLRDRAFAHAKARFGERWFGLKLEDKDAGSPPRIKRFLLIYAVASFIFTISWVYALYLRMLIGPLVDHFQGAGLVLAVCASAYLLRRRVLRPLGRLVLLLARRRREVFTRRRSLFLAGGAAALLAVGFSVRWPMWIEGQLSIEPRARAAVRAQVPGIVEEIWVREGDRVEAGQRLALLGDSALDAALAAVEAEIAAEESRLRLLERGTRREALQLAEGLCSLARGRAEQAEERARRSGRLAVEGLAPVQEAARQADEAARVASSARAAEERLALARAGALPEETARARAVLARLAAEKSELLERSARFVLVSPIAGVVATPHLEEQRRRRLGAGETLLEIDDVSTVIAEITFDGGEPWDEVRAGAPVRLRLLGRPDEEAGAEVAAVREMAAHSEVREVVRGAMRVIERAGETRVRAVGRLVVLTTQFSLREARPGMSGHARVYGPVRSLAYQAIYLPLRRLFSVRLWSMW